MKPTIGILIALFCCAAIAAAQSPWNLRAESPASLQPHVTLTWDAPGGIAFFKIYRSSPDTSNFQWIAISQSRRYEDPTVSAGTLYHYVVTGVSSQDTMLSESGRSNIATARAYALGPGPKGVIAGTVTDAVSGLPIRNITIRFFKLPAPTNIGLDITTTAAGTFAAAVDTGTYIVRAEENVATSVTSTHKTQWYLHAGGPDDATRLSVTPNDTTRIVFPLTPGSPPPYAYVSGIVTDSLGQPIAGAVVAFIRPIQEMVAPTASTSSTPGSGQEAAVIPGIGYSRGVAWYGYTNTSGKYFAQVPGHRDYVALAAKDGYYAEYYDNVSDPTQATILPVADDTTGINFSLQPKGATNTGSVEGTVEDSSGTEVPARIILFPRPKESREVNPVFTYTDSLGHFLFEQVESGSYTILAIPFADYAPSFATNSGAAAVSWLDADSIAVDAQRPTVRISVPTLAKAGLTRVSGRVLAANGTPLPGVRILARESNSMIVGYGLSNRDGGYAIEGLGNGSVTLLADRFQFNLVQAPVTIPLSTFSLSNVDFVLSSSYPAGVIDESGVPSQSALSQNYPNPFNPVTRIGFRVWGLGSRVKLAVYDLLGREVAVLVNENKEAGNYTVTWNAAGMASGMYVYRLMTGGIATTRKMILAK